MSILSTLTLRNLKLNKKRTIVTIVGIVLAVALICAVAGMFQSLHQTVLNDTIKNYGDYHVRFRNIETSNLDIFDKHDEIESMFIINELGYAVPKGLSMEHYHGAMVRVVGYDSIAIKEAPLNLIDGRLPTNANEVVIVKSIAGNLKIGDTLTLDLAQFKNTEELIIQDYFYYYDEIGEYVLMDKPLVDTIHTEYIVVGFIDEVWYGPYDSFGYNVITYSDGQSAESVSDIYVRYDDANKYALYSSQLAKELDTYYEENGQYLELIGASFSENTNKALFAVAAIVIGIIMLTSIFVIKNGFSISVVERHRQFGMLSSIGATSKQIRRMVLFEGLVVGVISILLGILVGCGAVFVLIQILNELLKEWLSFHFDFHISMLVIYGTVLASGITIFFACLMPAWKVSRISPIDAIRNSNDIKIKAKKLRTPKYIEKLFGIGGAIAHKNLKRSKKKYRTTIVSLVVSIVIFIAISSFIQVIARSSTYYFNDNIQFDIIVNSSYDDENDIEWKTDRYNEIAKLEYIERYSILKTVMLSMNNLDIVNKTAYKDCLENEFCVGINVAVMSVGEAEFKHYLDKLGVDPTDYKHGAILLDEGLIYEGDTGKYLEERLLDIGVGDTILLEESFFGFGKDAQEVEELKTHEIEILKLSTTMPMSYIGFDSYNPSPTLIISDEYFDELFADSYIWGHEMYIATSDIDALIPLLDTYVEELEDGNIQYFNITEEIRMIKTIILVIQIFLYGFIGVISLIGVTNIFNTITTNMALRSREFAMLKSVGMTGKEFNRMIRLESILYGLKSLLIGIPIGIGLSLLIYNGMEATIILKYRLPIAAIIISIIFVFIIVFITMKYSLNKINKQNIIETIRSENI